MEFIRAVSNRAHSNPLTAAILQIPFARNFSGEQRPEHGCPGRFSVSFSDIDRRQLTMTRSGSRSVFQNSPSLLLCLLLLAAFVVILSFRLWPEWSHNPDFSHGLFMPLLFGIMLYESRTAGPQHFLRSGHGFTAFLGSSVFLALSVLSAAGLYATALGWSHALVQFLLTLSLVFLLAAGLAVFSHQSIRLLPFNGSSLIAVGLWLICTPLPPGTYTRLTLALQLWVSESVLRALHLLGIAAFRTGNIIELAHGSVGVEDACSGVRSLLSCIFAGFFFSATLVRRPWDRALVIGLAVPLALGMNFLRSLLLTLLANSGVNIAGAWHNVTGYSVLAIAAAFLGTLAYRLGRRSPSPATPPETPIPTLTPDIPKSALRFLSAGLLGSAAVTAVFVFNTRPNPQPAPTIPDLIATLPPPPPGWTSAEPRDLYQFTGTLQTSYLAQRTYTAPAFSGPPLQITLYLAYWPSGQSTVSRVATHTPDACWPGSGWIPQPLLVSREPLPLAAGRILPVAEHRFFTQSGFPQHVWFWHLFDGRPISYQSPYSPRDLLQLSWRYGFRHEGDQLFIRVSSTRPWNEIADTPLLHDFFSRLHPLGL